MSSSRSDDSKSSFYAAFPDPCDKCRFTTCFSLHAYTASGCPYKLCPGCRELEILDAQIAEAHTILINLSQKRYNLKARINRRHDQLTSRLPLEIISHIFNIIAIEPRWNKRDSDNAWHAVVLIGAVCKRWRDITLGIPQLWTKVVINPLKHASSPEIEITEQWISRSCALPLFLRVDTSEDRHRSSDILPSQTTNIFRLLRSQASRWENLSINSSREMFRDLLDGLEDRAPVDSLGITVSGEFRAGIDNITMKYPLVPKTLHIVDIPVPMLPVHWHRLTSLTANRIQVDELLYIFRSAHNLRNCTLSIAPQARESGHYPIPVSPSINKSVTSLSTLMTDDSFRTQYLIQHLTLPSLETLFYTVTQTASRQELDALFDFLDRSQSPLQETILSFRDTSPPGPANIDWYRSLSSITYLDLYIAPTGEEDEENLKLQAYIQGLKADLVPMALPYLQELRISASGMMNIETWDALADIFPDSEKAVDTDNASPVVPRPLNTVNISLDFCHWENREIMRRSTFRRLRRIRESGVDLAVFDEDNCDLLDGLDVDYFMFIEDEDDGNHDSKCPSEERESVEHWE